MFLSDLSWVSATNGWGSVERDLSNGEQAAGDGGVLTLNGVTYTKGLGVHANSEIVYTLGGSYTRFISDIGVDDSRGNAGSIIFQVWADGVQLFDSGTMTGATPTLTVDVDLIGRQSLRLVVTDSGNGFGDDHGNWANARILSSASLGLVPSRNLFLNLFNASPVTLRSGVNFSGSLVNCGELAGNGASLSDLTISATTGASGWNPVLGSTATNVLVRNCSHGIRITASGSYAAMQVTLRNNTIADVLIPTGVTGAINLSSVVFPVGSTTPTNIRYEGTGTITVTVNRAGLTTSTPNGGTVVLVSPVISLTAPNFQQGTSVEVSRVNTYTLASSGINIATGVITLAGHQFRSTGVPTLIALVRQPGAVLPAASTPFERVDPGGAITPLLLSVVNVSGSTFQLATSDGGTPITFSNAGSGNFTIQGFTRLDFSAAGVSGYTVTLTETTGTLLEVKARFWQNTAGCTASLYYQARFIWSSVAGLAIADTLTVADTPDTVHNTLIGRVLTLANGTTQTVAADGSAIAGMSANQNGIVIIDRASGLLITQDAYCWFVWYSSTSAGIRLTNKEALTADSLFDFVLTLIQIRNVNAVALEWLGGYIRTNNGSRLIATGSNAMYPNAGQAGIAIAVSSGGGGLDAAGVRSAIGLASANLDTQLSTANTRIG